MMRRVALVLLGVTLAAGVSDAEPVPSDVAAAYARGDVATARELADDLPGDDLDAAVWRYRLAARPAKARAALDALLGREDLPADLAAALRRDAAWAAYAAGENDHGLSLLKGIPARDKETAATTTLIGGLLQAAAGERDLGRDAWASVKPDDPGFSRARYLLGRDAASRGDDALAARYLETAATGQAAADALAAIWMLQRDEEPQAAETTARELAQTYPRSPARDQVEDARRRRAALVAPAAVPPAQSASPSVAAPSGTSRYAVQLAAFADRSLALSFLERWRGKVRGLRIDVVRDDRGQTWYKVRAGAFNSRGDAARDAERIRGEGGPAAIVVDLQERP